jgi:hypothetical protein
VIHFKFKLQLKCRNNNKNYSSIIVNFHSGYHKKFVNLQLKFRKSKSYNERKTVVHWYTTVTSLLLKPLQQHLIGITLFRLSKLIYSQSLLFEHRKNFSSVFTKPMDRSIYKTKFQHVSFFVSIVYFLYHFNSSLMLETILPFMTVATLSHYQSPVKCRNRTAKVTLHTKELLLLLSL